jgi:hypothetical protein
MQAMPGVQGVASGRVLSAGATVVFGAGLALYQLTSLVLGPAGSRQLDLSLTIPAVEVQDLSEPMVSNIKIVVGIRATPAASASQAMRVSTSPRAASAPITRTSGQVLPLPSPFPLEREGHPAGKKLPVGD